MIQAQDILLDLSNEIIIRGGDFLLGDSDDQHVSHIGEAEKGNYAQSPTLGVGIKRYLNSPLNSDNLSRDYRLELEKDGYRINSIKVSGSGLSIDYTRIK